MTSEKRTTIELKDITHIEFRCKKCGSAVIHSLSTRLRIPSACGNCSTEWHVFDSPEVQRFAEFLHSLARYAEDGFPYELRLQVTGLEEIE